ncbi:nuclear pore complex assembly-domain-containing protein [Lyophyllum atratum]|nr:nuclear pore complex assembly-domain-containing protein [Lyophyllum atratum]
MDEQLARTPQYLQYFDVSSTGFAWREPRPDEIVRRRADMDDKFIFDILLASGGVEQPDALYPPRNVEDLELLLLAIEDSTYDILKQECLVYYLLKWHQDGREERFQIERCIPPQFTSLADAYWHLDTGINVPRAVSILSDNRLNREFVSKILHAISISPNPSPLIVQYVRTAKPLLTTPQDVWTYTLALADISFLEAWRFQRTFNETEELRKQLLEKLLEWCISPEPRPQGLSALLCFPLSPFEEDFLHKYALEPPKSLSRPSIAILRDLICVRLIQSGKYADAVKVDHQFASSTLNESKSSSQERRKMVQDLYAALPQAERTMLDAELQRLTQGQQTKPTINGVPSKPKTTTTTTTGANKATDVSMSQSWEEIQRPLPSQLLGDAHTGASSASPFRDTHPPVIPLSERSGAPRFGGPILGASTSTSTSTAAPILPISKLTTNGTGIGHSALSSSQSFTLSSSTARPRASLGRTNPPQFFPGTSTKGTSQFTTSQSQPSAFAFSPASRKPNAFYKPPPGKPQGVKRPFDVVSDEPPPGRSMDVDSIAGEEEHMEVEYQAENHTDEDARSDVEENGTQDERQGADLGFSVFGNGPGPRDAEHPKPAPKSRSSRSAAAAAPRPQKAGRRVPPGAFMSEDEDGEDELALLPTPAPPPSRTRTSARQGPAKAAGPSRSKRVKRVRTEDLGRSLPGSLMDEEEDGDGVEEAEEEEADYVAPLRQASPPRRAGRRVRSTTPVSDMGDDEGMQTRRRSTRLSTTGSIGAGMEPSPPKKAAGAGAGKGRKSARTPAGGAAKKKRQ